MTTPRSLSQRLVATAALLITATALAVTCRVSLALGAYQARVTNSTNTAATATYFTCRAATTGEATTIAYLAYPLDEATGVTAFDSTGNNRNGTYTNTGVTYASTGPCPRDTAKAITLNGSTGYLTGAATPTNPQIFSIEIWFKTTTGGGKLIGLGTSKTGASAQYDRHLYLTDTGIVTFGVYPGAVQTITSPTGYLDGKWHQAVATLAPAGNANPGMRLYIDGALVASNTAITSAEADTGYWRIGYDNLNGWTNKPTNFFFTGSLANASTYTYALTPTQVAAHNTAGR